jgi:leucine dehydrogenase
MSVAPIRPVISGALEEVRVRRGPRSGLTLAIAIDRVVGGHALGGCRFKAYPSPDEAVRDAQRLAQAMTFKAGAAGLLMGGGKGVIAASADGPLSGERRQAALRDFAELIESFGGVYVTGQDVGTTVDDIAYMSRFTEHVAGRPIAAGGCGDPSPFTAHGVEVAIRASLPGRSVSGAHVVVVGLGHVGGALAARLAAAGAQLTVTDVNPGARALASQLGAKWVSPEDALFVACDVLAPCALGGTLNHDTAPLLRAPVIAGAANNQLSDDSVAAALAARGIRWAPDFVANAGGLIAVVDEHMTRGFDRERVERAIEAIGDTLAEVYRRSAMDGVDTLTAAQALAAERRAALASPPRTVAQAA